MGLAGLPPHSSSSGITVSTDRCHRVGCQHGAFAKGDSGKHDGVHADYRVRADADRCEDDPVAGDEMGGDD